MCTNFHSPYMQQGATGLTNYGIISIYQNVLMRLVVKSFLVTFHYNTLYNFIDCTKLNKKKDQISISRSHRAPSDHQMTRETVFFPPQSNRTRGASLESRHALEPGDNSSHKVLTSEVKICFYTATTYRAYDLSDESFTTSLCSLLS